MREDVREKATELLDHLDEAERYNEPPHDLALDLLRNDLRAALSTQEQGVEDEATRRRARDLIAAEVQVGYDRDRSYEIADHVLASLARNGFRLATDPPQEPNNE